MYRYRERQKFTTLTRKERPSELNDLSVKKAAAWDAMNGIRIRSRYRFSRGDIAKVESIPKSGFCLQGLHHRKLPSDEGRKVSL